MMELLSLYSWTLPAGCIFSGALALLGCQLASRDRAMQTVCVSQGAMLGVLLALAFEGATQSVFHADPDSHLAPFVFAFLASAGTFLATDVLAKRKGISKNTLFAAVFSLLLASGHFVTAVFPALESHMSQIYFGDLATLTEFDAKMTLVLGLIGAFVLIVFRRPISGQSFELATFGHQHSLGTGKRWALLFNALSLSVLCFSVQFLGLLFTIALLFLPTTILRFARSKGLSRHLFWAAGSAMASTGVGFALSLYFERFPTVPTVTLTLFALTSAVAALESIWNRPGRQTPSR